MKHIIFGALVGAILVSFAYGLLVGLLAGLGAFTIVGGSYWILDR